MDRPVVAVVPAYNEQDSIGAVVSGLRALRPAPWVTVVDDGSSDATAERATAAGARVLRPPFNLGIGGAVQLGFRFAREHGARAAVQVDGDGQHPPDQVAAVLEAVLAGRADVAIGSRFLAGARAGTDGDRSTATRRLGSRWLAEMVRLRCGRRFSDPTSGLRAYAGPVLDWLAESYPDDYPEPQVLAPLVRRGLRIEEVPVVMAPRRAGRSSISGTAPAFYVAKVSVAVLLGSMR